MKPSSKIALILSLLLTPAITFATVAKVIEYKATCGYLLVEGLNLPAEMPNHFLLLKQQGNSSYVPKKGDMVDGFYIENYGIAYLRNVTTTEILWVYNENSWLFIDDAVNKYVAKCGPIPTPKPTPEPKPEPKPHPRKDPKPGEGTTTTTP